MNPRRLIAWALAVIAPLMFTLVSVNAAAAAAGQFVVSPAAASTASGCHDADGPAPMQSPGCRPECPLACAPLAPDYRPVVAPMLPYARLHFVLLDEGLSGRAPEPELPPPRRLQT